jgi:hypothetical protein
MQVNRYNGFDYLRAYACVSVVLWHTQGLDFLIRIPILENIVNIVYYNFCLIAVPIFFQVSLFLTYSKGANFKYIIQKKVPRLFNIFFFWTIAGAIFLVVVNGISRLNFEFLNNHLSLINWILRGGFRPELYFLISLIILTIASGVNQFFFRVSNYSIRYQFWLLILFSLMLYFYPVLSVLEIKSNFLISLFSAYWNPLNFFPYIFSALILNYYRQNFNNKNLGKKIQNHLIVLGILFISLSATEWLWMKNILGNQFILPPYSRISLVLGSSLILYLFSHPLAQAGGGVTLLSSYSLGIYCLHYNLIYPTNIIVKTIYFLLSSHPSSWIIFILTLLISILIVKIIRNVKFVSHYT